MVILSVEGMSCGHCVKAITQAIQGLDPQAKVTVDLGSRTVTVVSTKLDPDQIAACIEEDGYTVAKPG